MVDIIMKVVALCLKYYSTVKNLKDDIGIQQSGVEILQHVFNRVQALMNETQKNNLLACDQALKQQEKQLTDHFKLLE